MNTNDVIEIIKSALSKSSYGGDSFEFLQGPWHGAHRPDLIIKAGTKNIAVIEITNNTIQTTISFSTNFYFLYKIRYYVYSDGSSFVIYDRFTSPTKYTESDIDTFVSTISRVRPEELLHELKSSAANIITNLLKESSNHFPQLTSLLEKYGDNITAELKLSSDYVLYFEGGKTDIDSFEHQFFRNLLGNESPDIIYRYCSFNRAFQILNDNTIAMQGLPGMNDTTEPNYVDNYVNDSNDEAWEMPTKSREAINRRFILSCTTLSDDLMQWRLYGEDGKGACIKFKTDNRLKTTLQFYLGKVKYANVKGEHPELILIRRIVREIKSHLFFDIKFILLYVWRHFFKPREFEYEQEIRLLYIHRKSERIKKWIVAEPYSIVNPMVTFNLSKHEFPLKVVEVMLGPNRPEKQLNKSQLEQMGLERKRKVAITDSARTLYRSNQSK